jgi:hypothetical protein
MQITVNVSVRDLELIQIFLDTTQGRTDGCTHGQLDLARLVNMLLQDVALMMRRPGSWEGSNMTQVMQSHGY